MLHGTPMASGGPPKSDGRQGTISGLLIQSDSGYYFMQS